MKGIKKLDENLVAPFRSLTITNPNLPDNSNWQIGTLKCNPELRGLQYKLDDKGNFGNFDATYILLPETVTSELIKNGTIQTEDLKDNCVTNDKIRDRTINHIKLQVNTLTDEEMASQSITTRALRDLNVTTSKLANKSVTNAKIADYAVDGIKIANNSINSGHIVNYSIISEKISPSAVTTEKLAVNAVTNDKIANGTIQGIKIAGGTITNVNIADKTITPRNLMNGAVETRILADEAVTNAKIAPKTILATNIADRTITSLQIKEEGISTINYRNASVTREKLADEIGDIIDNAVVYDAEGNVTMLQDDKPECRVVIGSSQIDGTSNGNGELIVNGTIRADRVYNMAYSDLAEGYVPGEELEPGDIVELREDGKVYKSSINGHTAVIVGVVSDEYAQCFGATEEEIENGEKVAIGLIGRIHVKVNGPVHLGDDIKVNNIPGIGITNAISKHIIGKALETVEQEGVHKVLCLVK